MKLFLRVWVMHWKVIDDSVILHFTATEPKGEKQRKGTFSLKPYINIYRGATIVIIDRGFTGKIQHDIEEKWNCSSEYG